MQKPSKRTVQNKKKNTPAKKKSPPKRNRKKPVKLNKANIDKVYNVVKYSGRIETAKDILNIARQTVYNWKGKHPQCGDTLSHASE